MNATTSEQREIDPSQQQAATSAGRRQRRPSLSDDELLRQAFDLFVAGGFERTSIDGIAAAVGIAKRTLYLRYGDKEGLFRAVLERAINQWIVPVERLRQAENDDLEASLLAIGRLLIDNILSPTGLRLLQFTNAVSQQMPEIGAHNVQQGIEPTTAYLADLFRRRIGADLRGFAAAETAAMAFINLVVGGPANMVAWGVRLDKQFIDQYVNSSVCLFLHGLLPPPAEVSAVALEHENVRLKILLADTMVQLDAARQELAQARDTEASPSYGDLPQAPRTAE